MGRAYKEQRIKIRMKKLYASELMSINKHNEHNEHTIEKMRAPILAYRIVSTFQRIT